MKRIVLGVLLGFAALAMLAPAALAHGGQFNGPGGAVPPGLREPSDPPPPPPPPPTSPPPTTTPPDPTQPPPPPPTTPPTMPTPTPPQVTGDPQAPQHKTASISYEDWTFWFNMNREARWPLDRYKTLVTKENPLAFVGEGASGNKGDAMRATDKQMLEVVRPTLLWAMDPKNRLNNDISSAAILGLSKFTNNPEDVDLIKAVVLNKELNLIDRESAALGLGELRRSDAKRQFDAKTYDDVRNFCFQAFENEDLPTRTRAFAMLSIGLLGDMPSAHWGNTTAPGGAPSTNGGGLFYEPAPVSGGTDATSRIVELLQHQYKQPDMPVTLLLALSLQPATSVKEDVLDALSLCALRGKLWKEDASDLTRAYAALALGRVGTSSYATAMLNALDSRATDNNVKRSAAIAIGLLGQRVDGAQRAALASDLLKRVEAAKDASVKDFGTLSLAYLLESDIHAKRTDVLETKKVTEYLLKVAEDGSALQRPFAALAIAIVGREITDRTEIPAYGALRVEIIKRLREGIVDQKMAKRLRAAFAASLGIVQDSTSKKKLVEIVGEKAEDKELRGYAAVALGMIGEPTPDVLKVIKDALHERASEELRLQTATALGYLGQSDAVPLLLQELADAETQNVQGQIVVALSKIGDNRAIQPLVDLLKSNKPDLTRALACAGLGLIGDPELIPTLCRIRKDINYRATCDAIAEVLTIL